MPSTLSPNMSLILPTVGQEPGPNWALDLNSSLSLVDQHNHAPGSGVQITPAGININTDLTLNSNNLVNVKSSRFTAQPSPLASGSDLGCIYVSGADLYYNDTIGNQVRLTIAGSVNGTPGSIGGLVAPATVTYVPANQVYIFQSNVNTSGSIDSGPITFRNNVTSSNGITLAPPTPLPGNYTITFPASTPASQKILTLDSAGNLAANYDVDNSTLTIASNTIKVANSGITQTQLANDSVGNAQLQDNSVSTNEIVDASVTRPKLVAVGQQESTSSGAAYSVTPKGSWVDITNLSVTITTTGRPVFICIQPDGTANDSFIATAAPAGAANIPGKLRFLRGASLVSQISFGTLTTGNSSSSYFAPSFYTLDAPAAGTYTYKVQGQTYNGVGYDFNPAYLKLVVYEL